MTRVSSIKTRPELRAALASHESNSFRRTIVQRARPEGKVTSPTSVRARPLLTTRCGTASGRPSSSRASIVLGMSPPAQVLGRGWCALSIAAMRPASFGRARRRWSAAARPAGPAPTIRTSKLVDESLMDQEVASDRRRSERRRESEAARGALAARACAWKVTRVGSHRLKATDLQSTELISHCWQV
jgi:hypothetical protein